MNLKAFGGLAQPPEAQRLVEDDRPRPERGNHQEQHRQLDDGVRLQEQLEDRQGWRHGSGKRGGFKGLN